MKMGITRRRLAKNNIHSLYFSLCLNIDSELKLSLNITRCDASKCCTPFEPKSFKISKNSDLSGLVIYETSLNRLQKFIVTGLEPGTKYYYQVTACGETTAINTFKTAFEKGSRQKFRFIVYGDTRTNHDDHFDVCKSMIEEQEVVVDVEAEFESLPDEDEYTTVSSKFADREAYDKANG